MTYSEKICHGWIQDYRLGHENNNKRGAHKSDHDLETGLFWGCHVQVAAAALHWLKWNWGGKGGDPFLPKG